MSLDSNHIDSNPTCTFLPCSHYFLFFHSCFLLSNHYTLFSCFYLVTLRWFYSFVVKAISSSSRILIQMPLLILQFTTFLFFQNYTSSYIPFSYSFLPLFFAFFFLKVPYPFLTLVEPFLSSLLLFERIFKNLTYFFTNTLFVYPFPFFFVYPPQFKILLHHASLPSSFSTLPFLCQYTILLFSDTFYYLLASYRPV